MCFHATVNTTLTELIPDSHVSSSSGLASNGSILGRRIDKNRSGFVHPSHPPPGLASNGSILDHIRKNEIRICSSSSAMDPIQSSLAQGTSRDQQCSKRIAADFIPAAGEPTITWQQGDAQVAIVAAIAEKDPLQVQQGDCQALDCSTRTGTPTNSTSSPTTGPKR